MGGPGGPAAEPCGPHVGFPGDPAGLRGAVGALKVAASWTHPLGSDPVTACGSQGGPGRAPPSHVVLRDLAGGWGGDPGRLS